MRAAAALLAVGLGCGGAEPAADATADATAAVDGPPGTGCAGRPCRSLRFSGRGDTFGDHVRFRLDDPATVAPGPPLDVGEGDLTIELWLRAEAAANPNTIACGPGLGWVESNIVVDRDRHSQAPTFGLGLQAGALVWAVRTETGALSLCGARLVADGAWHHVAVDRRRSDGRLRIFVDGALDVSADGPDGSVAYPDDGVPLAVCPRGSCAGSDPFLVLGAEKHGYPGVSFTGGVDELRVSRALRYQPGFAPPTQPVVADADTVGLYHFDDGPGAMAADASGAQPSVAGELVFGGAPPSPSWSDDSPFP